MQSFLESIPTFSVSMLVIGSILFAFAVIVGILLFIIKNLQLRIHKLTRLKYGFGGKPLRRVVIVFSILVSMPLVFIASRQGVNTIKKAFEEHDMTLEIQKGERVNGEYVVDFYVIPQVNNEPWGDRSYDIVWSVTGEENFEKIETSRSKTYPSYFEKKLKVGLYSVTVTIESKDFYLRETYEFEVK